MKKVFLCVLGMGVAFYVYAQPTESKWSVRMTDADMVGGLVEITNACAGAGLGGTPYRDGTYEYYIHETKRNNDPKSVGLFIMLSLIYEKSNRK